MSLSEPEKSWIREPQNEKSEGLTDVFLSKITHLNLSGKMAQWGYRDQENSTGITPKGSIERTFWNSESVSNVTAGSAVEEHDLGTKTEEKQTGQCLQVVATKKGAMVRKK